MQTRPPRKFILLLTAIAFSNTVSNAQIIYTDVIPDQTFNNNGIYQLDLNNDSIIDFNISYTTAFPGACSDIAQLNFFIRITPTNYNAVADDNIIPLQPIKVDSNSLIDKSLIWKKNPDQLLFSMTWLCQSEYWVGYANGYWINTSNKFLPLKLRLAGVTYYGWLGIDVDGYNTSFGSFRIKDYAYNSIAATPILAGETTCAEPAVTVATSGPLTFCSGDSVILTATSNAYLYQWRKNGVNIIGATSATYVATTAGTYKVKVTNSCGSKASKNKIVTVPCRSGDAAAESFGASTTDKDETDHLSVYPNPASSAVTIHLPSDDESTIQLINLFGAIVFSSKSTSAEMLIDVNNFAAGIYTARWISADTQESKTFAVVK